MKSPNNIENQTKISLFPEDNQENIDAVRFLVKRGKNLIHQSTIEPHISLAHTLYTFIRYTCPSALEGIVKPETATILSNRIYMTQSRARLNRKSSVVSDVYEDNLIFPTAYHILREYHNRQTLIKHGVIRNLNLHSSKTYFHRLNIQKTHDFINAQLRICSTSPSHHEITKGIGRGTVSWFLKKRSYNARK